MLWVILGVLVGAIAGQFSDGWFGVLAGGVIGALFARLSAERSRLDDLERAVEGLRVARGEAAAAAETHAAPAPMPAPSAAAVPTLEVPAPAAVPVATPAIDVPEPPPSETSRPKRAPQQAQTRRVTAGGAPDRTPERDVLQRAWTGLMGDNPVVRVGIAVLFIGVAILVKYAHDRLHLPIELRLSAVAAGAIAMLITGFRLRVRRPDYGLVLQGGGVALLYLTVFGALKIWALLAPVAAFVLFAAIALLGGALAVLQGSRVLAVIGTAGGFLAPIIASTGAGDHVVLFGYYAVLNLGVVAVARYRAWRGLNVLGFAFTFVIGTLWGVTRYSAEHYWTTQPFLVFFVVLYTAIALLYADRTAARTDRYLDATLVFGVPVIGFALQAGLTRTFEYGVALSALIAGAAYLSLATVLMRRAGARLRMLVEAYLAIGVAFATLAVPLAFDGRFTAGVWALEGAALVWVGLRQGHVLARVAGYGLSAVAGALLLGDHRAADGPIPFADSFFIGTMLLALGGAAIAWWLRGARAAERIGAREQALPEIALVWTLGWLAIGVGHELVEHVPSELLAHASLAVGIAFATALVTLDRRLDWPLLGQAGLASILVLAIGLIVELGAIAVAYPSERFGWIVWPLVLGAHAWILRRAEARAAGVAPMLHAATAWLVTALVTSELTARVGDLVPEASAWQLLALVVVPAIALGSLARISTRSAWPFGPHRDGYLLLGGGPIAAFLALWILAVNLTQSGAAAPLPYVPILNPLDLATLGSVLVLLRWLEALERAGLAPLRRAHPAQYWSALAAVGFVLLNALLVRVLHHYGGVDFSLAGLAQSKLAQSTFSIFWTVLALGATVLATRWRSRGTWIAGAALLGVVVAKLFVVDLSGGVERVVSFIVVGLLMLAIGYLAPMPPKSEAPRHG